MSRTSKEQEAYLVAQYFNGTYNDADYTCTCSGNTKPVVSTPRTPTPVINNPTNTNTEVVNPVDVTTGQNGNNEVPVTDATNNPTYPNTVNNPSTETPTSDEIISNALPTFPSTDVSSQSGNGGSGNGSGNTLNKVPESTKEVSTAGGWLLALVALGFVYKKFSKGGKNAS